MEKKVPVNLKLAENLAEMLEAICAYHDSDKTHILRQLIVQEYRRVQADLASREGRSREEFEREVRNQPLPLVAEITHGEVPPKVSGRKLEKDQPKRQGKHLRKTG